MTLKSISDSILLFYSFFNLYCGFYLCKKYEVIDSFIDFLFFKNIKAGKFLWKIGLNKSSINIEKDFRFYVIKYTIHYFILHHIVFIAIDYFLYN
ncbi:hypothetical protein D0T92_01395 [Neisseria zalophi]|uniref:Uncharacterized protein n=1 Tax=Neisseria zalophi TaxID=640030 RepID=A0A5J6PSJ1_9NEIS|nr:hypothetical protein D0T92_01395 [Neisseria zalophi]